MQIGTWTWRPEKIDMWNRCSENWNQNVVGCAYKDHLETPQRERMKWDEMRKVMESKSQTKTPNQTTTLKRRGRTSSEHISNRTIIIIIVIIINNKTITIIIIIIIIAVVVVLIAISKSASSPSSSSISSSTVSPSLSSPCLQSYMTLQMRSIKSVF